MERKVWEVFEFEGKRYEVVECPDENIGCYGYCAFSDRECCYNPVFSPCHRGGRTDNKEVYFVEVKE